MEHQMSDTVLDFEPAQRLTKDLAKAAATLSAREARYLVDAYYMLQGNRIASSQQVRTLNENDEPHDVIKYLGAQNELLENQLKRALDKWTDAHIVGRWAKSIMGIGPVIAAGLLAHIDIALTPGIGNLWSFAGLNPTQVWEKGQQRPFNQRLKTLAVFKLGESFVKVHNRDADYYGKLYAKRKRLEEAKNEAGDYKALAAKSLPHFNKTTDAFKWYSEGKLPPARIHARARRYAVKIFLSHYYLVAYFHAKGELPRVPYVFEHVQGHSDFLMPPNLDMVSGLSERMPDYLKKIAEVAALPKGERRDSDTGIFPIK
jgi:hypothetical protein